MLGNLLESTTLNRFELLVISLTTLSPVGDRLAARGIPVIALGGRNGVLTLAQLARLARVVRVWQPDVIHTWMYHANVTGHMVRFAGRGRRPALITSVRGALHDRSNDKVALRAVRRIDAFLSARADRVVFNSAESARQHVEYGYASRNIEVIPNGFDAMRFIPSAERRQRVRSNLGIGEEPLVGIVGRFDRSKGHRFFLGAAAQVATQFPQCRFALIGRGCEAVNPQLQAWINEFRLDGRVMLLGERRDVAELDCALDVVASSSISESFPNSIGEAMACATPVIVTDVGDCRELVGDCGIVVPPRDENALSAGLIKLLRMSSKERADMGRRGRERIMARYTLPAIAERFESLYANVQANRKPA
jgi:glycosyltransferase involved in cell wall biosynthesis